MFPEQEDSLIPSALLIIESAEISILKASGLMYQTDALDEHSWAVTCEEDIVFGEVPLLTSRQYFLQLGDMKVRSRKKQDQVLDGVYMLHPFTLEVQSATSEIRRSSLVEKIYIV